MSNGSDWIGDQPKVVEGEIPAPMNMRPGVFATIPQTDEERQLEAIHVHMATVPLGAAAYALGHRRALELASTRITAGDYDSAIESLRRARDAALHEAEKQRIVAREVLAMVHTGKQFDVDRWHGLIDLAHEALS